MTGWEHDRVEQVYRPALVRVLYAVCVAGALWWVAAVATGPRPADLVVGVPVLAAVGAIGYAAFWRAAVIVDGDGVRLLNVVRDVAVPWPALEAVQTRYALTLVAGGRAHRSWAAAAPGRPSLLRSSGRGPLAEHLPDPRWTPGGSQAPAASRSLSADSGAAAFLVEQGWARWRDTPRAAGQEPAVGQEPSVGQESAAGRVLVRWNVPVLAVTAGGTLLAVLAGVWVG